MTDEPFNTPDAKRRPPRAPQPRERVWTLTTSTKRLDCELRDDGEDGCEAQLIRDGEFYAGRRFPDRAHALAHATAIRSLLEGGGWVLSREQTESSPG